MPKRSRFEFIGNSDPRWVSFGKWLEIQRSLAHPTQEQAAAEAGISRRHWIRYSQGDPVPVDMIPAVARAIHVPVERVLVRAGYERSNSALDVNAYLQRVQDSIIDGDLVGALCCLFRLYHKWEEKERALKLPIASGTAEDFARAAVALDRMPGWLRYEFGLYVLATALGDKKQDFPLTPKRQQEIREMIKKRLPLSLLLSGCLDPAEMDNKAKAGSEESK